MDRCVHFARFGGSFRLQVVLLYKKYPGILAKEGQAVDLNMLNMMKDLDLSASSVHSEDMESVRIVPAGIGSLDQPLYTMQFRPLHQQEWKNLERFQLFRPL